MGKKRCMKKVPLALFVFVVILTAGTATAAVNPNTQQPDAYVVESGKMFTGPTAIQDSIDSSYTQDGYNVYVKPGNYSQQLTMSKSITLKGMGANPEDTTIEINTDGDVITVPDGVTVTLKNMAIINTGTGTALSDTGMINLIDCVIIENYVEPTVEDIVVEETTEMDTLNDSDSIINDSVVENQKDSIITLEPSNDIQSNDITTQSMDLTADTGLFAIETPTTTTTELVTPTSTEESITPIIDETPTTGMNESSTPLEDGRIPLTTMAYGMLMVVGGVILPRKNQ